MPALACALSDHSILQSLQHVADAVCSSTADVMTRLLQCVLAGSLYPGIKLPCTVKRQEFRQHACALQSKGAVSLEVAILCAVQLPCKAVYASHTYHFLNVHPVRLTGQNIK